MSTRAVPVRGLEAYIGRHVSFTFTDGWDDWPIDGVLIGLDKPDDYHLTYISTCNCGDEPCERVPLEHGAVAMHGDALVHVNVGGRS